MRVAHVIPGLASRTGGPAASVVEASLALRACDVESTIFTTDLAGAASASKQRRIRPEELPDGADQLDVRLLRARRPYRFAFSPSLYRALRCELLRYDVVHIHSLYLFPQLAGYRQAVRDHRPFVVSPRGALDPYLRQRGRLRKAVVSGLWQRALLTRAAALHLTSAEEATLIADIAPSTPRVVVPNGIRWREYQQLPDGGDFRRRHLGGHDGPVLLNLGRISHKKGLDTLIQAFALVAADVPACRLVLAGPDDERLTPHLHATAERERVADRVVFAGMLRGGEKLAALAAADVWALPSRTENFGLAVVEALAAGLPTVISPAVNIAGDIAAADAGIVCEHTAHAVADAIAGLLRDDARRAALGRNARMFARRYDWDAVAPQLAAMYAKAASG